MILANDTSLKISFLLRYRTLRTRAVERMTSALEQQQVQVSSLSLEDYPPTTAIEIHSDPPPHHGFPQSFQPCLLLKFSRQGRGHGVLTWLRAANAIKWVAAALLREPLASDHQIGGVASRSRLL